MEIKREDLWKKAVDFHGHVCPGLAIGFRAALYAMDLLDLKFSEDEDLVCVAENDACGVDAIQVLLGCSLGKGNLLFHMRGKQAWSFYDRASGKSLRLVLKNLDRDMTREEAYDYYQTAASEDLFKVMETKIPLPEKAQIFSSYICDSCGEKTGEKWIRLRGEEKLCLDCYEDYNRFDI